MHPFNGFKWLPVALVAILHLLVQDELVALELDCALWPTTPIKANDTKCQDPKPVGAYPNVPILGGVYCFNDGSYNCKAFSGRYEFQFNTKTGKIKAVEPGDYVNSDGWHSRVPVSYTITGDILYADQAIKWANDFAASQTGAPKYNLLNASTFNWCELAIKNQWPYKSAIVHHDKIHHIYFFNRQTCIHNSKTGQHWFYNHRSGGKSNQMVDLDPNPTIFAMQDHLANDEIRMVKHKRLHWLEVKWSLEFKAPNGSDDGQPRLRMDSQETKPCALCDYRPLISASAYSEFTDICVTDYYLRNVKDHDVINVVCGLDQVEVAEDTGALMADNLYEILEHGVANRINYLDRFLKYYDSYDKRFPNFKPQDCETYEKPLNSYFAGTYWTDDRKDEIRNVLTMYTNNRPDQPIPSMVLSLHKATRSDGETTWTPTRFAQQQQIVAPSINQVDDIAYLHKCASVLVIYGPLYTEIPTDGNISLSLRYPVGSVADLGVHEPVSAFIEIFEDSALYFYHRLNYISTSNYTCGANGKLVTAKKYKTYFNRYGNNVGAPKSIGNIGWFIEGRAKPSSYAHSEEQFFRSVGLYKGDHSPDAPLPGQVSPNPPAPGPRPPPRHPDTITFPLWAWLLLVVLLLAIVAMSLAGYLRYQQNKRAQQRTRSARFGSNVSAISTGRSAIAGAGQSQLSAQPTGRSAISSGYSNSAPKPERSQRSNATHRSALQRGSQSTSKVRPNRQKASGKRSTSLSTSRK